MDRVETPTEELLRGIAKALEREITANQDLEDKLSFLRASVLDCYEAVGNHDAD